MSDEAQNQEDPKVSRCIVAWQASEQSAQKRMHTMPKCLEAANPTIVVLNLGKIAVGANSAALTTANVEEIKSHKGVRVTFLVLKTLSPGWTWVGATGSEKDLQSQGKKGAARAPAPVAVVKDKLNAMVGEHLQMHSYDLTNVRGTFVKSARSSDCAAISPGMVISLMVWGKGFLNAFKLQNGADLQPFDICTIQLGIKSMQAPALENGNMLEIKSYSKICGESLGLGSSRLLANALGASLQECAVMRSRFVEGLHCGEIEGLNQAIIKGNVSTTVSVVKIALDRGHGTFAIGADDIFRFHVAQSLADLPCNTMAVQHETLAFGASKDWVCKLFNVLALTGGMELLVIMDSYQTSKTESQGGDIVLDAFARPNISGLIGRLLLKRSKPASEIDFVTKVFPKEQSDKMAAFELAPDVVVVLDTRLLTKKVAAVGQEPAATLVHPNAPFWERGYAVHFFLDGRLVHCAVVPLAADGGTDGSKHVLTAIAPPTWDDVDIEMVSAAVADVVDTVVAEVSAAVADVVDAVDAVDAAVVAPKRKRAAT